MSELDNFSKQKISASKAVNDDEIVTERTVYVCEFCDKVFSRNSNVKRHIADIHFPKSEPKEKFICHLCSKSYTHKNSLTLHLRKCGLSDQKHRNDAYDCSMCDQTKIHNISEHYRADHDVDLSVRKFTFDNLTEFSKWKEEIEESTISNYVLKSKSQHKDKLIYYYRCHRDGYYRPCDQKKNIRRNKSYKINGHCPAKMTVSVLNESGIVSVSYMPTHVGHTMDLKTIPLKPSERIFLAEKILKKVPFDVILREVKDNLNEESSQRLHLLTRQDLVNIERAYSLSSHAVRQSSSVSKKNGKKLEDDSDVADNFLTNGQALAEEQEAEMVDVKNESKDEECPASDSSDVKNSDLLEHKNLLLNSFCDLVNKATTVHQCNVIQNTLVSLETLLNTFASNKNS
ncbi:unnamed protein product [Phyllotreta striolata]|uniref:C2H2-type domain-containing protein n=1 Tax=Phyllotreta striolata TaxID=444603 RepID=A0A9N9XRI9_PHYSR|nr:unnamed protein product [Phyllotreta striolata]